MIFPGSRLWFEGAATDLSLLTEEIKGTEFSGHIILEFQESLDLVIVSGGEFIKVLEKIGRRIMTTRKYREIWGKCQIKQGRMFVFELPPDLVRAFTGMTRRRQIHAGCRSVEDFDEAVRECRRHSSTSFLDGTSRQGKILIEFRGEGVASCHYTEYQGLAFQGYDAFVRWHESLRSGASFTLNLSDYDDKADNSHLWDGLLMEGIDDVSLPMVASLERLFDFYGSTFHTGEEIFREDDRSDRAYYLLEGSIELSRRYGGSRQVLGYLGEGAFLGLSWLNGLRPPPITGTAVSACRILAFDRTQLEVLLFNSPALASSVIFKAASLLTGLRRRLELFGKNPKLKDLESYVIQVLNRDPDRIRDGLPAGDLFRELTQVAPFSLPEMDQMVRALVNAGRIELTSGRVILHPEDI